jgi:asparagine synthase (glutamine-hydrolysing)
MCGVAGYLHFNRERMADFSVIKKMTDIISYRGPDGEGHYVHKNLAFGHRRLSIIDLSTGDQPMFNENKTIALIFNGEIYNYIELKEELKKLGHSFYTNSDAEVIIKSYQQWGLECQNKFNGMWAFALWDDIEQQLLLSRDRIGEKPLHYVVSDETIIFGSEIKSLFAYGISKESNIELLEIYLTLGYIPAPYTFYKNINKLKAGHCLIIREHDVKEYQYWDLPEIDENHMISDKKEVFNQFESLFKDSIKIRMRSDVPYGAFLSGGLDSSSIVALMSEISSYPVETFTIGFNEKAFDERYLANQVAQKFKTNHHEYVIEPDSFNEALWKVVHHYDEPFGDPSAIPTGHVSRFAASKVKMVLTGDGGDEVLSGYTNYQGEKFASLYKMMPGILRKTLPSIVSGISVPFKGSPRLKLNRIKDVFNASNLDFTSRYLAKSSNIDLSIIKEMTHGEKVYPVEEFLDSFLNKCSYIDPFYKLMYLDLKLSLPDQMLVKVDRMSMAYSLETRTPFLDYRIIDYMAHVHKDIKMDHFERKSILRNVMGNKLPASLLNAPKKGFSVPLREWFKEDSFIDNLNELKNTIPFINKDIISKISKRNNNSENDYGDFIWMLFVWNKIMEEYSAEKMNYGKRMFQNN